MKNGHGRIMRAGGIYCLVFILVGCAAPWVTGASSLPGTQVSSVVTLQRQRATVQMLLQSMSLEQKLGQLIAVEYIGSDYQSSGLHAMITHQFVGGFIYQQINHNFDPPYNQIAQVHALSMRATKDAHIPLLIATDQEGGLVNRLYTFHGALPSAQQMGSSGNPSTVLNQGKQAARWMSELGINTDFAPVVDVHTVDPPILSSRLFGRTPLAVATYAGAYLDGLQTNGIAGCLKHFPGLGSVSSDPHAGLPIVKKSKADLEKIDLAPYKTLLRQNHPAMIMATDVLVPAIDPHLPAELSPLAIDGLLRKELGYDGVVITDGLYMQGISAKWSLGQAAVLAIIAGDDLIEGPFTQQQVANVITAWKLALKRGQISMKRINQSVQRILLMKVLYKIIK